MARPKSERPINETADALITITASLPGHSIQNFHLKMKNFSGNTMGDNKRIERLREVITASLIKHYGNIIK